jgi:toxin ParE1/3/4
VITFRLSPAAKRDVAEIWLYTADIHGADQAENYVAAISGDIERLLEFPHRYETTRTRNGEFRKMPSGHHLIFYQIKEEVIAIIRILHERMDWDEELGA